MRSSFVACAVASASVVSIFVAPQASAGMVAVSSRFVWDYYVGAAGLSTATEGFGGVANGTTAGPVSGSVSGITWTVSSAGGILADAGVLSAAAPVTLTFTFSPGVYAVAGNFFGLDAGRSPVPVLFAATLADGTAYSGIAADPSSLVGFVSTAPGQSISSLSVTVTNLAGAGAVFAAADSLYLGVVPAPGAVALLAAAGLVGSRGKAR